MRDDSPTENQHVCTVEYGKYSYLMKSQFIVYYAQQRGRTGTWTTVATSSLENNSWVWWPTWHLHNLFFFVLNHDLIWTPRACAETSVHNNMCKNFNGKSSQYTESHNSRREHTHKARTLHKPLTCANVYITNWLFEKSKIRVGLSRNRHSTRDFKKTAKVCCCWSLTATDGEESDVER